MMLTLQEVKEYLRVEHNEEDDLITKLIMQVQDHAESYCRVKFDDNAPEGVKLACLMYITHFYENRGNEDKQQYIGMRMAFENMLYPNRDPAKMF